MCENFFDNSESIDTLMTAVAAYGVANGIDYDLYWHVALQDTTIDINKAYRQWTYEYCRQFAYF